MLRTTIATLAGLALSAGFASAGWDHVFQVTCNPCKDRTSYYAPPPPERKVEYVQRSYYQPVTEYRRESFYTPVEEKVKSYYYEPVTSYKYTTYYDPCSGCPQDVATPVTSYRVREKCNTVTKWVERSRTVPVTSYRQVTTMQPVVTYYYPPQVSSSYYLPAEFAPPAPRVDELRGAPPTVMPETSGGDGLLPKQNLPTDSNFFQRSLPNRTANKANSASLTRTGSLRGEIVQSDRQTPRPNTKIIFVNPEKLDDRISAKSNEFGDFDVTLPAGEWYVYLGTGEGKAIFHKKLTVRELDNPLYRVVSR